VLIFRLINLNLYLNLNLVIIFVPVNDRYSLLNLRRGIEILVCLNTIVKVVVVVVVVVVVSVIHAVIADPAAVAKVDSPRDKRHGCVLAFQKWQNKVMTASTAHEETELAKYSLAIGRQHELDPIGPLIQVTSTAKEDKSFSSFQILELNALKCHSCEFDLNTNTSV